MKHLLYLALIMIVCPLLGQSDDPVLFTVADGTQITRSEFKYIYEKNNADRANYSENSLAEYLQLYKNFKLKVHHARQLGLDTIVALQKELEGYRKQLASTYLKDKEIANRLVNEVMKRMQEDREVSHIFVKAESKNNREAEMEAESKIYDIYDRLQANNGKDFKMMAKTISEDKVSSTNAGYLGYYTSPLPDGFYEFENAMYSIPVGQISKPVKSKMGWHVIRVSGKRPARGEVEIAHILVRKSTRGQTSVSGKAKIDSVYANLQKGRSFESLAAKYSDDHKTRDKGGYLGYMGINQYDIVFEDTAYGLTEDGSYTKPFETKVGYHIIKRLSKRDDSDPERTKKRIESKINNKQRFKIAEEKLVEDVKEQAGFSEDRKQLRRFVQTLDQTFYSYKWEPTPFDSKVMTLFTFAGKDYTLNDFNAYAKKNVRERLKFAKSKPFFDSAEEMYEDYVKSIVIAYEEANLESKYEDFKALMREYREGILLFEITKNEVWDKASQDSIGLQKYFGENTYKYKWEDRARVKRLTIEAQSRPEVEKVYAFIKKKGLAKAIKKYKKNTGIKISTEETVLDKKAEELNSLSAHNQGAVTKLLIAGMSGYCYIYEDIIPATNKTLDEARGYVIADYQDFLEKKWVNLLKEMYPIDLDMDTFKSMIK